MLILSIIIIVGCLLNSIINGFDLLNIVYLVLSVLFLMVQLPLVKAKFLQNKRFFRLKLSTLVFASFVVLMALSGLILNPFKAENEYISKMKNAGNLIDQQKYIQAQTIIDGLLKEDETNVDVLIFSGVLNLQQNKFDQALGFFNKAYSISPYDENVLYNLSVTKYKQFLGANGSGSPTEALSYMETLVNQSPRLYSANLYAGQMAMELQQYKKAKYYFLNAQLLRPDIPQTYYHTAKMNYSIYEYKEALKNIKIALSKNPGTELKKDLTDLQTTIKNEAGGVFDE